MRRRKRGETVKTRRGGDEAKRLGGKRLPYRYYSFRILGGS